VPGGEAVERTAERVRTLAELGVTHVILRSLDDALPLARFTERVAGEVRPLVP
jgi:hypothetical protein